MPNKVRSRGRKRTSPRSSPRASPTIGERPSKQPRKSRSPIPTHDHPPLNTRPHVLDHPHLHHHGHHPLMPGGRPFTRKTYYFLLICLMIGIARWYTYHQLPSITPKSSQQIIDETLHSMLSIESRVKINRTLNVAVGLGSCLDIYVSSEKFIISKYRPPRFNYYDNITTQWQLNQVFAYFFMEGAAAERFIENRTLFEGLVERAISIKGARKSIGGNAAVMAKRIITEGVDRVFLGTQYSKLSKNEFDHRLVISGPTVDHDDVHICIEYPAGQRWGPYVAPRANRLIIHSDHHNPSLRSIDNFLDRLASNKDLDLLVIGGLQMMDSTPVPVEERHEKLKKLGQYLSTLPAETPKVHLELASFTEEALLKSIKELIIPHVHSMGMNEQELPTLLEFLIGGGVEILSGSEPRVATTLDQMRQLYQMVRALPGSKLTRIHAHTLAYQAILTKVDSGWRNTLTSAVKASLTAHRYTCGSPDIDVAMAKLIMDESYTTGKQAARRKIPFNSKHPANCWEESISIESAGVPSRVETIEICVAPVLVCTKVKQTAGAGDNVSAAGLIFQF